MKKIKDVLLKLLYILVILVTTISIIREVNTDMKNVILCFISIILYFVPVIFKKFIKLNIPIILKIVFVLFIFATIVLGEVNSFYELIPIWDDIIHIVQGFFVASIGFSVIYTLFKNKKINNLTKFIIIIFSLSLSLSIGVIWEIVEYTVDRNVRVDMQKDMYIHKFNSILLNPKKDNEVMEIKDIGFTSIYDRYGKKIVTFNGYLDIGLCDTMDDLIDTLIGSLIFCGVEWLYLNSNKFVKNCVKI